MAVPWMFHGITLDELVVVVDLNFVKRVKSIIVALIITSTNQEELLSKWILDTLEVVREAAIVVWLDLDSLHCLVPNVELEHILGVFLEKMNYLNWRSVVLPSTHIELGPAHMRLPHCRSTS